MRGIKSIKLGENDYLHFWYANNRGRGSNNCTIVRSSVAERAHRSANQTGVIFKVQTSSWHGNVNFSQKIKNALKIKNLIRENIDDEAEIALSIFENAYPDDKRPRAAIQAAKNYIADSTKENAAGVAAHTVVAELGE